MGKVILRILNSLVNYIVLLALLIMGLYSVYSLWDNHRIYTAAENVQADMLVLKPETDLSADNTRSFEELRKINPDVCAWLSLDKTKIDYPVLRCDDNLRYINTDVYGNFALAGSIFLDSRCDDTFSDRYSLLYGHHMDNRKMFGDLDLYKDEQFFNDNSDGLLMLSERTCSLKVFACLLVPSSEKAIFEPQQWRDNVNGLLEFVLGNSEHLRQSVIEQIRASDAQTQILAMSTCASEFTDARTVVLAVMEEIGGM